MTTAILNPLQPPVETSRRVMVVPLGFMASDLGRLHKIFELASADGRHYVLVSQGGHDNHGDILLVNHDEPGAVEEQRARLRFRPHTPVVVVSKGPLAEPVKFHLRGMLIGVKLLSLLDKVPLPHQAAPSPELEPMPRQEEQKGFRVLVVDDSVAIQKSLEIHLKKLPQVDVIEFAKDGEEALQMAENDKYDLIFLDVMMPGIDGYETCGRLRKQHKHKKTPIIMVSGNDTPLDEVKGVIAGCTTYLIKPVQTEAFMKLSSRILDQANANRGFY